MAAVERVAGTDPDPGDPFRGLYISDEVALRLTQGDSASSADDRLEAATRALGLDLLDSAVLAVCAAATLLWVPQNHWDQFLGEVRASTFYVENWQLAHTATDYFARAASVQYTTPSPEVVAELSTSA